MLAGQMKDAPAITFLFLMSACISTAVLCDTVLKIIEVVCFCFTVLTAGLGFAFAVQLKHFALFELSFIPTFTELPPILLSSTRDGSLMVQVKVKIIVAKFKRVPALSSLTDMQQPRLTPVISRNGAVVTLSLITEY